VRRRRKVPIAVEIFWILAKLRRLTERNYGCADLRAKLDEALIELAKCHHNITRSLRGK
jgi:hypothetical protein